MNLKKIINFAKKSSFFNYLTKLMGLYFIDSWDFALNHKTGKDSKLIKGHLYNFDKKFTYIKLNRIKVSGWYFLGICHLGDNNNLVGYVKSDNSSLKQGRKMPSTRIRWRIIYLPNKLNPFIKKH